MQFPSRLYAYVMLALALAGGFIIVTTFAFGHSTANAIDIGVAAAVTLVAAATCFICVIPSLRAVALLTCVIGAATFLVTIGVFSGETQRWLTFAFAAAIVATSIAAQVVNVHANELPAVRRVPETKAA
jgi:hypothetical protein